MGPLNNAIRTEGLLFLLTFCITRILKMFLTVTAQVKEDKLLNVSGFSLFVCDTLERLLQTTSAPVMRS